jgi:uncharacterized protein involved in exopolysaccharide biosynthesis
MKEEEVFTIDFKALFRVLWKEKWWMVGIVFLFGIFGVFYAFNAREEFISSGKILPEVSGKGGGGLSQFSGLAAMAGVDLGAIGASGTDAMRPDLYPNVISSTPFYLNLLKAKVRTKENKELTFEQYYHSVIEEGQKAEDKMLKKYPVKEEGIIVINQLNELRLENLRDRVTSSIDKKSGVIFITAKMPDPVVAADVTQFAMKYLMDYITNYRTEKYKMDVDFLGEQLSGAKGKYYSNQQKRASYADQYQMGAMRLQSADVQRERLESDYRMSSTVYNEILKKYEEAKFMVHKETPVFKVLEPPVVPVLKSEPRRAIILFGFVFLGSVVAVVFSVIKGSNYKYIISSEN